MAAFSNLSDVSNTLKTFLLDSIPELLTPTDIVFQSPANLTAGPSALLSIFLYRVSHNPHLRNAPPIRTGISTAVKAPLPLDLEYLFTPFSTDINEELTILEKIAGLFTDNAILSGDQLEGSLAANGNTEIRIVPNDLPVQEINQLWQAFQNNPYHLGLSFIVSPVYIPSTRTEEFTRVIQRNVELVARYTDMSPDI